MDILRWSWITLSAICSINKDVEQEITDPPVRSLSSVWLLSNLAKSPTCSPWSNMNMWHWPQHECGHLFKCSQSLPPTGVVDTIQDPQRFEPMNIKFYCPLSCLNIVVMLCATVDVTVAVQTLAGAYFCEPCTFIHTINLTFLQFLSESWCCLHHTTAFCF